MRLITSSIFMFRRKYPDAPRPYRAWGYPVVPVIFLFVSGWLLINTMITAPTAVIYRDRADIFWDCRSIIT